jgi:soluble lytic murein transglycosylase-like protein
LLRVERAEDSQKSSYAHWLSVMEYARHYRLGLGLSHQIYRIARAQHIDPELAFRLVRVESNFVANAVSYAGAVGLTQLMPGTARYFKPGVTPEELMDPETNLRIGFRYLRVLVREFDGNLRNALLTYNRGPTAVYAALLMGEDPGNGYDRIVLRGYAGRGVTD